MVTETETATKSENPPLLPLEWGPPYLNPFTGEIVTVGEHRPD